MASNGYACRDRDNDANTQRNAHMLIDTHVRLFLLCGICAIRVLVLAALVIAGIYDPTFATYITYTAVTIVYLIGIAALFEDTLMRFYARWIYPVALQITLLVQFLIIIILFFNDSLLTSHAIGGDITMGEIMAADAIIHTFPVFDCLVVLILLHHLLRHHVRVLWLGLETWGRLGYILYVLLSPIALFLLYNAIFDVDVKYPVPIAWQAKWFVTVVLACFTGMLFVAFMLSTRDLRFGCPSCSCGRCAAHRSLLAPGSQQRVRRLYVGDESAAVEPSTIGNVDVISPWGQRKSLPQGVSLEMR